MSEENMNCRDAIGRLVEYLDAELDAETVAQLEAHLRACAPCRAYLATYKKTKDLAAKANRVDLPESLKARLRALLAPPR